MPVGSVRGAVGPPDVSVKPRDALKAARLFLRESVGCVEGPAPCQGRDHLQVGGRGRGVRGVLVDGSVRPCGSGPGALPVHGLPAQLV